MSVSSAGREEENYLNNMKYKRLFSHPFSFKGRIGRLEYALTWLICYILFGTHAIYLVPLVDVLGGSVIGLIMMLLIMVIPFILYWFLLAQGAKRCHDRGNSGWYQIIPFYILWMLIAPSDEEENNW